MTIKDIARESGYAIGTVSRVLNNQPGVSGEARRRVMEVVEKYHFKLNNNAKLLKQQYNHGIAIIVKGTKNMLFAALVETLQKIITESGYACLLYYIGEDEHEVEQALQVCRDRQPMGILFLGSNKENFKDKFELVDVPCVIVTNSASGLEFPNLSSVSVDDVEAGRTAVDYLISLGHEKIGILGGEIKHSNPAKARYEGCVQAFEEHHIQFNPKMQFASSYFTMEGGYNAMCELLQKTPELTAVFAMSDVTALGAIRAIKDVGLRIPEDVSVVGYDGVEIGRYIVPKLTTIQQPGTRIAERCVKILLQCIENKRPSVREQVDFTLVAGESTRKIK
ncbi:MAG: LacI family DNA-binding transcriptional regulator [Tyzzerella sp.]|nr:LacI family DNA-binding transcriptional regulator [Tyzzerella sp.]